MFEIILLLVPFAAIGYSLSLFRQPHERAQDVELPGATARPRTTTTRIPEPEPMAIKPFVAEPEPSGWEGRISGKGVADPTMFIGSTVDIEYIDTDGVITRRVVNVQGLTEDGQKIRAFCHLRRGLRHFFIERTNVMKVIEGTDRLRGHLVEKGLLHADV